MGGSTTTTVTQAPPSEEEKRYLDSQAELSRMQLEILGKQDAFNTEYLNNIKPILDQQFELTRQQLAAANDPVQQEIDRRTKVQQLADLATSEELAPLQRQVLQKQLEDTLRGNAASPEQAAQIDAATNAALERGRSDINAFTEDQTRQLRQNLSPALGLRPTDTPIVDRGQIIAREGVRQYGNLTSDLAVANAEAKLNYPLAAAGVGQAQAGFAAGLDNAAKTFQAGLQEAANTNRLRLLSSAGGMVDSGTNTGIGLVTGSRGNPLSFQRGSTQTTNKSIGIGEIIGGLAGGLNAYSAIAKSDGRAKYDVKTVGSDGAGHRWVRFKYKEDPNKTEYVGVIAQEAEKISPEAVLTDGTGTKFVNYRRLRRVA